jgi:hypothetical protein
MSEDISEEDWSFIKIMLKRHWKVGILFIIGIIAAIVGAILTLFFVMFNSDIGGYGNWTIGDFSFGHIILFLLWLVLWELLFVGIPAAVFFGLTYGIWWYRLPQEEKELMKQKDKEEKGLEKHSNAAGGVFGFIVFIVFLILISIDGNLFRRFNSIAYSYWIIKLFWALLIILLVAGIPALIGGIIYLRKKFKNA